jgi:hypothetical protein
LVGPQGATGANGATGAAGVDGKTILNGTSNPLSGTGANDDFFLNTTTNTLFGPKTISGWGSGISLVGPQGIQGPQGLLSAGTATGNTPYWNGTDWVVTSNNLYNNGSKVGINTPSPSASAILEVSSTSQGVLFPRMTKAQRQAITAPATGLLVFQTDAALGFYYFDGSYWIYLTGSSSAGTDPNSLIYTINGF